MNYIVRNTRSVHFIKQAVLGWSKNLISALNIALSQPEELPIGVLPEEKCSLDPEEFTQLLFEFLSTTITDF